MKHTLAALIPVLLLVGSLSAWQTEAADEVAKPATEQEALTAFNDLIGGWRGIGQPQRGSARGAWKETADWAWSFDDKRPALVIRIEDGKQLTSGRLTYDLKSATYRLHGEYADQTRRDFTGRLQDKKLTLLSEPDDHGVRHRVSIWSPNSKRLVVLLERSLSEDSYFLLAEIGYTRAGTRLAVEGGDGPECVVTGGKGTSTVQYMGKTYYVCCTGCRQAFEDDPPAILAAYQKKLTDRKATLEK